MELNELIHLWEVSSLNSESKNLIEYELRNRIDTNNNFSREYFFEKSYLNDKFITISFIPTSVAYLLYGSSISVSLILSDIEIEELSNNYSANPVINTSGRLKANLTMEASLTQEQIDQLATIGFHTNEIFEVTHH